MLYRMPQFFECMRGDSPREVGHALFAMIMDVVLAAPVGGRLTDRFDARNAGLAGCALLAAGALAYCRLPEFLSSIDALVPLLLIGFGQGLYSAPNQSAAMAVVAPEQAGVAAGVISTLRYLGGILGVLALEGMLGNGHSTDLARHALVTWAYVGAAYEYTAGTASYRPTLRPLPAPRPPRPPHPLPSPARP